MSRTCGPQCQRPPPQQEGGSRCGYLPGLGWAGRQRTQGLGCLRGWGWRHGGWRSAQGAAPAGGGERKVKKGRGEVESRSAWNSAKVVGHMSRHPYAHCPDLAAEFNPFML